MAGFTKWICEGNNSKSAWKRLGPKIATFVSDPRTREKAIGQIVEECFDSEQISYAYLGPQNPFKESHPSIRSDIDNDVLAIDLYREICRDEPAWHKLIPLLSKETFVRCVFEAAFDLINDPQRREHSAAQLAVKCLSRIETLFLSDNDLSQRVFPPAIRDCAWLLAASTDDEPAAAGLIKEIKISDSSSFKAILLPSTVRDLEDSLGVSPSTEDDEESLSCWQLFVIAWPILIEPSARVLAAQNDIMSVSMSIYSRLHKQSIIGSCESFRLGVPVYTNLSFDMDAFLLIVRWVIECMIASHDTKDDAHKPFGVAMALLSDAKSSAQPAVRCALAVAACEAIVVRNGETELSHRVSSRAATLLQANASLRLETASQIAKLYSARSKVIHGVKIGQLLGKVDATTDECAELASLLADSALAAAFSFYASQPHLTGEKDSLIKAIDQALYLATPVPGVPDHLNCGFPFGTSPSAANQ